MPFFLFLLPVSIDDERTEGKPKHEWELRPNLWCKGVFESLRASSRPGQMAVARQDDRQEVMQEIGRGILLQGLEGRLKTQIMS
jgi:hypothetical protein